MSKPDLQEQVTALSAKVTALTMLVESLYVDELSKDADPAAVGNGIIQSVFDADRRVREKVGDSTYALQISEALTSLIDRAVARALSRKLKGGQDR